MKNGYEQLTVWKESFELSFLIYQLTKTFPKEERYGISSQMRRCSLSIPSNIAEGKGRLNDNELRRFCLIAYGSAMELDTQLKMSKKLGYGDSNDFDSINQKLDSVLKLLNAFLGKLSNKSPAASG